MVMLVQRVDPALAFHTELCARRLRVSLVSLLGLRTVGYLAALPHTACAGIVVPQAWYVQPLPSGSTNHNVLILQV